MEFTYILNTTDIGLTNRAIVYDKILSKLDNSIRYQFYRLVRTNVTWLFALEEGESIDILPDNCIIILQEELDVYNRVLRLKSFM